jgi:PKHD-type hydroxylase
MDMALMRLRQRELDSAGQESAESVALTGTYHNLLRLWART